ncbi:MAG: trigger factor [Bacteroidota bacterium]
MNITQEPIDELNAGLKIEVDRADYFEKVETKLKDYQRKSQMPGFRPGKVPYGMIKKMYAGSVFLDEINEIVYNSMNDYIRDNNLDILGSPLPNMEKTIMGDWETVEKMELYYDLGFAPAVTIELEKLTAIPYYNLIIPEENVDNAVETYRKRFGETTNPESIEEGDVAHGVFEETENGALKEGGLNVKTLLALNYIKDEKVQKEFIGKKKGESVVLNPHAALGSESEVAAIFKIKKEEVTTLPSEFKYTIEEISRVIPAELNEEFFKKVLGEEAEPTIESFKNVIRDRMKNDNLYESDKKFMHDSVDAIMDSVNVALPDDFLKRWLVYSDKEGVLTPEKVETDYPSYVRSLKWQLVESSLIKDNNITITPEEMDQYEEGIVRTRLAYYGRTDVPDEEVKSLAKKFFENPEEKRKNYDYLLENKLLRLFSEKITKDEKEISYDDFVKMVSEHHH